MQINGAHLATAFAPKPLALQEQARKPVTIDAVSDFKIEEEAPSQEKITTQTAQADIAVTDGQQARFVRFFATNDEVSSQTQAGNSAPRPLPQGVQQYLDVADLQTQATQNVLDELV